MSAILIRQWKVLQMVPRAPRKIDTRAIVELLRDGHQIKTTSRTIQRHLVKLAEAFPLDCDEKGQHYGWSWRKTAPPFDLPGLDPQTALTLKLASVFLPRVLPRATLRFLDPHVKRADAVLKEELGTRRHRDWSNKVRTVPRGLALIPPTVRPDVLEAIYDAVFEERCLQARYVPRALGVAKERTLHPLGLVYRDAIAYLVCSVGDHDGIVTLAIHRIEEATVTKEKRRAPDDFDLDAYIASGSVGYRLGEADLEFEAYVEPTLAQLLAETPIAADQLLVAHDSGRFHLRARLADTWDLRAWLLAQGDTIEIVGPVELREELGDLVESAAAMYGRPGTRRARATREGYLYRPKRKN